MMRLFAFSLAEAGVFPQQRSPQVLWIGAEKGVPHLTRLAECLNRELEMRGYQEKYLHSARKKSRISRQTLIPQSTSL